MTITDLLMKTSFRNKYIDVYQLKISECAGLCHFLLTDTSYTSISPRSDVHVFMSVMGSNYKDISLIGVLPLNAKTWLGIFKWCMNHDESFVMAENFKMIKKLLSRKQICL